jgi:hypothetical protein
MDTYQLNTPIALIIFNRPDSTAKVFEAIRRARPPVLFVAADGCRSGHQEDIEQCRATRAIIEQVDWKCEVLTHYSDINLGVKNRPVSAFNWVFEQVEEAILLEDDCLPHPSFFQYCEELLQEYRHDPRIMTISGDNTPLGYRRNRLLNSSYYFSIYPRTWGWATWRRAWKLNDIEMQHWLQVRRENWLADILSNDAAVKCWEKSFEQVYRGLQSWDQQWVLSCWLNHGLSIIPHENLITNLGFTENATNTTGVGDRRANVPGQAMAFPLQHPPFMIADQAADAFTQKHVYDYSIGSRIEKKIRKTLHPLKAFKRTSITSL